MVAKREAMWLERRALVGRWERSGLSMAEFCRRERVGYAAFVSWKRRFSDGGQEAAGFAELVVASATGESTRDARTQEAVLEVELADGARVRVFARADAVLVRAAVEAVRAC